MEVVLPAWSACTRVWSSFFLGSGGRWRYETFVLGCRASWRSGGSLVGGPGSIFPRRRRSPTASLGPGSLELGRVPDRWICSVCFFYCGSSQSHVAMELLAAAGDGWWWRIPEDSACCGPMDLNVISSFFRGLCASRLVVQLCFVSYLGVSVFVLDFVLYP